MEATPRKPKLNKLKGQFVLTDDQRQMFEIEDGFLMNEARDWSNMKKVVEYYFKNIQDGYIELPSDFINTLKTTLKTIADVNNVHNGPAGLLQRYCASLYEFYSNKRVEEKLTNHYSREALVRKMKGKERDLKNQSKSTMMTLVREQGQIFEEESESRMNQKRRATDEGESSRTIQKTRNTDEEQTEHEEEISQDEPVPDSQESFNSLERHPLCRYYYDYFVSDKREKWSINSNNSWISPNQTNISQAMYEYRVESYKAAKLWHSISAERILALSFIFVLNQDSVDGFITRCKSEEVYIRNELDLFRSRRIPDEALVMTNNIDNLRANKNDINRYLATSHGSYWDSRLEMTTYFNIVNSFHQHYSSLQDHHTEQDHDAYEFFTKELFKSDQYVKHRMSKHLVGSDIYIPDYKLAYEYQHRRFADIFIVEVKKHKKEYTPNTDDIVKINLELQKMLNRLIALNIPDPVVYGMVIQGHECTLYQLTLKREGQYISNVVESFFLPRDKNDISLLPRVTAIFLSIKDKVDLIIDKIINRAKGKSELKPMTKQGMSLPLPIKDPVQFLLENREATCSPPT